MSIVLPVLGSNLTKATSMILSLVLSNHVVSKSRHTIIYENS